MLFILAVLFAIPTYGISLLLYAAWWYVRVFHATRVGIENAVLYVARNYPGSAIGTCIEELSYRNAKTQLLEKSHHHRAHNEEFNYFKIRIQGEEYHVHLTRQPDGLAAILRVEPTGSMVLEHTVDTTRLRSQDRWEPKLCRWFAENGNVVGNLAPTNLVKQTTLYSMIYATVEDSSLDVPPEIGNMVRLETLSFTDHAIATLPRTIGKLRNLKELLLLRNRLERLPEEICALTGLAKISLIGNRLRKLPDAIGDLTSLRELWLSSNALSELPRSVTRLTGLVCLDLTRNPALTLTKEQRDWIIPIMRQGAQVHLDEALENEFVVAHPEFLGLYGAQKKRTECVID